MSDHERFESSRQHIAAVQARYLANYPGDVAAFDQLDACLVAAADTMGVDLSDPVQCRAAIFGAEAHMPAMILDGMTIDAATHSTGETWAGYIGAVLGSLHRQYRPAPHDEEQ